ncbi:MULTISPECIES: IS66 family transposase [unclassified Endozoicomonas]|uniref:IS66 family transposase n=1 Tax=unclassified Endozoicomonas TaxID=2644528 RepID=UPI003BB7B8DB
MLAYIIVARFCDALHLYRQEKILACYGGSVTRTTMANWLMRLSRQLTDQPDCSLPPGRHNAAWVF